jgi:hypothetical protein
MMMPLTSVSAVQFRCFLCLNRSDSGVGFVCLGRDPAAAGFLPHTQNIMGKIKTEFK